MTIPAVDGARLLARLDELATYSATPAPGVTRLAYSAEDIAARELVAGWMREAGLTPQVDEAGNLLGRRPGGGAATVLAIGSHLDTVVDAGPLDGAYGVVAAVEVAAALRAAGVQLRHDLAVIAFSNEEGARGTPGMVGSLALTGQLRPADLDIPDDEGVALRDRIAGAGGDPDRIRAAAWPAGRLAGFIELHVEQGPVLDDAGLRAGVVTAVTGRATVDVTIEGAANHAGTTPMGRRADAAVAAARIVLAVRELAGADGVRVATAGHVELAPNVRNVVPGRATVGVDLRDTDDDRVVAAVARLRAAAARVAGQTGTRIDVAVRSRVVAAPAAPWLAGCVRTAVAELGLPCVDLPSGAGHDAQIMAALGPIAMAFVPSLAGVSHAPGEATRPEDLVAGADVLCRALVHADTREAS
ncbi:hydantoinase/carbamoylase family amidase [Luedemannella helvata]|uniref:Zn-dependent hydrolase n=1 Tax=Luedemannella helvata TaxID=349315 RepID=A0ABP4WGQ8_9ACTN